MALCGGRDRFKPRISKHGDCREVDWNCLSVAMLPFNAPRRLRKHPRCTGWPAVVQQSESVHRSRARAACDVAEHETDGTTTCLDRGSDNAKDDTRARQADLQKEIAARQPECRVCQMHPDFIDLGQADASYGSRRMSTSGCRIQS